MCAHSGVVRHFWSATGTGTVTIRPRSSPCDRRSGHARMVHHFPLAGEREKCPAQLNANFMRVQSRHQCGRVATLLPTQNSHSPRPSDLTARFQRPAAVYSRPRYSPLYPGTVNSEPGAGRSGFSYRIPRVTDRACTHTHTLAHCTVQCRVVPTLLLELQTQPIRSEIYTFLQEVEVYSVRHVIVI
jgi:hypothetical protein